MSPVPISPLVRARGPRWSAAVLTLALLLAQLALVVHAADHAVLGNDAGCVVCVHAHGPAAGAEPVRLAAPRPARELSPATTIPSAGDYSTRPYGARAPPAASR